MFQAPSCAEGSPAAYLQVAAVRQLGSGYAHKSSHTIPLAPVYLLVYAMRFSRYNSSKPVTACIMPSVGFVIDIYTIKIETN